MSSNQKSLDELLKELPADSQEEVRSFAELLSNKNELLTDPEFRTVLNKICRNVLSRYYRSSFYCSEELQQDLLLKIAFDELTKSKSPKISDKPARKLKQNWAGGLSDYREQYTSLEFQKKALEWRGN
jgi:hypothetical protein